MASAVLCTGACGERSRWRPRSGVLVLALAVALAGCHGEEQPAVQMVGDMPGWRRAWSHEAMEPLYNTSLRPDMAVFRSRVRLLSALGIANQLRRYHMNNTRVRRGTAVVLVRRGRLSGITFDDFNPAFAVRLESVVSELQRHQDAGHIALPDSIFILNTRDVPLCSLGFCLVPLFSAVKEVRNGKAYNEDLLVPLLAYPHEQLAVYPPDRKIPRGVMVAHRDEAAGGDGSCRSFVSRYAREPSTAKWLTVLDAQQLAAGAAGGGAAAEAAAGLAPVSGMAAAPVAPGPLARYRVVISCDCQTANPSLASLLHTNSLVMKGRSNWAEFYYRALQDGVHYREFDPGMASVSIKEVLESEGRSKQARIIEAGQQFAYTFLSQRSRALFYEKAITEYNTLFGEGYMQATVAQLPADRAVAMADILALPQYPRSWRQGLAR